MKQNPLVSIIIPVYGTENYLPRCIDSIRVQTYPHLQILLVDDQSPDRCPEICDAYAKKDSRITVIHQQNKGVSGARNTGLGCAVGDYIMFVDSDDELEANAVDVLLNDIVQYHADIASASKCVVAADGVLRNFDDNGAVFVYEGEEMIKRSLLYDKRTRSLHAKLFAKELIEDVSFVEGHNINEDGYYLFECYAKNPKVVQHDVSVYKYVQRETSASHAKFSEKYLDMLFFCELKMQYIREKKPHFLDYAKDMAVRTNLLFLDVLCRTADAKYKELQKKSIKTVRELYRYHRPINDHHKKLAWIVAHGLYPLYKWAVRLKYFR
ncbi:MAG: glycosyltransferase family 2 protein [Ruminococcaceae bacterium]|nr:glycosyltransferase family 2 protein [Oscillospiraceae bacterium]